MTVPHDIQVVPSADGRSAEHEGRQPLAAGWTGDPVVALSAVAGLVVAVVGLALGRPQVLALATPLVLSALWSYAQRPRTPLTVTAESASTTVRSRELTTRVVLDAEPTVTLARLRASVPGKPSLDALVVLRGGRRTVDVVLPSVRTGPRELFTIDAIGLSEESGWASDVVHAAPSMVLVLPSSAPLDSVPVTARLRGLTGPHSSRRPGDGPLMRDIAQYRPGDSVRRVDWRTTARRSPEVTELYVRRTFAASEATVILVLDSRDDMGPEVVTWGGSRHTDPTVQTSLDIAREAAAAVALAVVDAGDRVGFEDLGSLHSPLPVSGGKRHLQRVVHALALARPRGAPRTRERPPQIHTGAMVYVFSTFLDDSSASIAAQWSGQGHHVVAVDTLPRETTRGLSDLEIDAWRLTDVRRRDRVHALRHAGVTVLRWSTDDAPTALRAAARSQQAHR